MPSAATTPAIFPPVSGTVVVAPWWQRLDCLVAIVATALIVFAHICFSPNVGGLWRDEVNTINLATMPTWAEVWQFHNQDSFPLLFAAVVRVWSSVFGSGDDSIRLLGLIIGLGLVAALWLNARLMGLSFPFWSLILVGANPMIIRYGDSARAYGLGLFFLVLVIGLIWKLVRTGERKWFALSAATAVLAVHATYYNAVLLFAICVAGAAAALSDRCSRRAAAVLGVGALAAISMLPYLPVFLHANDWNFLVQYPFTLPWMWTRLSEVTGSPNAFGVAIWSGLFLGAVAVASVVIFRGRSEETENARIRSAWFCGVALIIGVCSYAGFLKLLNYYTQPWYYLSLVTFIAVCLEPLLWPKEKQILRPLRGLFALVFLALTALPAARIISTRHTNIDLVAQNLAQVAAPEDLILLTRWECGVTMKRYYKGRANWSTIPPLTDFHFQAYQPIMARMREEAPIRPILIQAAQTMKSGHRVWLIGETPTPLPGEPAPFLPRVGDGKDGWRGSCSFYNVWIMQVTHFLRQHFVSAKQIGLAETGPVSEFEDLGVSVVQGWK
jgi:hypothetical protein